MEKVYKTSLQQREWQRRYNTEHREERRLYMQKYCSTHKEELRVKQQEYHKANREKQLEQNREWHKTHPGYDKEYLRNWRRKNLDKERLYDRRWYRKRTHIALAQAQRRRARENSLPSTLSGEEWETIVAAYEHRCAYCGEQPRKLTMDHIVPISRGGGTTAANVVPACQSCNSKKRDKTLDEFFSHLLTKGQQYGPTASILAS